MSARSRSIPRPALSNLVSYLVVDDVGTVINPLTLAGQIHGGVAQGVGQVLMEQVVYDKESGQLLTASFMDYAMPRADTMCNVAIRSNPVPTATNLLGAKGAGEAGCVGALPAVMIAILNALEPLGVRELDMPATSERIWQAIQKARADAALDPRPHEDRGRIQRGAARRAPVWVLGEGRIDDVTTHPATRPMVEEYVTWYDRHFDPAWQDLLLTPCESA